MLGSLGIDPPSLRPGHTGIIPREHARSTYRSPKADAPDLVLQTARPPATREGRTARPHGSQLVRMCRVVCVRRGDVREMPGEYAACVTDRDVSAVDATIVL